MIIKLIKLYFKVISEVFKKTIQLKEKDIENISKRNKMTELESTTHTD